jgi:hypothetical protein
MPEKADAITQIKDLLEPDEVKLWFVRALPEIRSVVEVVARVDGIDAALKDVKQLYLAFICQRKGMM